MLPFATVIILAGLTAIPKDIPEAAAVDGAGFFRTLFQITLPMMLPIMNVALLFGIIFTFTDMTVIYILTRGGPVRHDAGAPVAGLLHGHPRRRPRGRRGDLALPGAAPRRRSRGCMLRIGAPRGGRRDGAPARRRRTRAATGRRWASSRLLRVARSPSRSTGCSSRPSSRTRDLYNLKNNPFLFTQPPTLEHLRLLFRRRSSCAGSRTRSSSGVRRRGHHAAARGARRRTRSPASPGAWGEQLGIGDLPHLPGAADAPLHPPLAGRRVPRPPGLALVARRRLSELHHPVLDWLLMGFFKSIPQRPRGRGDGGRAHALRGLRAS